MTDLDRPRRITSGPKPPQTSGGVVVYDEEPGPEQKIRKWALALAVESFPKATAEYLLQVAEKFELFIADGTMDR